MALGQHRDAGHAAIRLEVMQMDVQQRRARGSDALAQRLLDEVDIVETLGVVEVDDQMHARAPHAVPHHEMIVALVG